jgi:hypothetical protein
LFLNGCQRIPACGKSFQNLLHFAEIVRRKKEENAEKYKNDPVKLEQQNRLVDQWARDNLDLM